MAEVTSINEAQGLWRQHKEISERIYDLADRINTISYLLVDHFNLENYRPILNDNQDGIIFIEVIEESSREMKVLIERRDEVRDEIDKVEGKSLMQVHSKENDHE